MKILTYFLVFIFTGLFFTMNPILIRAQGIKPPESDEIIAAGKTETPPLSSQIRSVTKLLNQVVAESKMAPKGSENRNAFDQDITMLKALIFWLESGNEAVNFPGNGPGNQLLLMSSAPPAPKSEKQTHATYLGDEIMMLPGIVIKRPIK